MVLKDVPGDVHRVRHEAAEALGAIATDKCECTLRQYEDDEVLEVRCTGSEASPSAPQMSMSHLQHRYRCKAPQFMLHETLC